jgi:hypothetical protein
MRAALVGEFLIGDIDVLLGEIDGCPRSTSAWTRPGTRSSSCLMSLPATPKTSHCQLGTTFTSSPLPHLRLAECTRRRRPFLHRP